MRPYGTHPKSFNAHAKACQGQAQGGGSSGSTAGYLGGPDDRQLLADFANVADLLHPTHCCPPAPRARMKARGAPAPPISHLDSSSIRSIPIRLGFVIRMDLPRPSLIGHARPRILVESRGVFQPVLVDVENKTFVHGIEL